MGLSRPCPRSIKRLSPCSGKSCCLGAPQTSATARSNRTLSSDSLHRLGLAFPKRPTAGTSTWTALRHSALNCGEPKAYLQLQFLFASSVLALCHTRFVSRNDLQPIGIATHASVEVFVAQDRFVCYLWRRPKILRFKSDIR